VTRSTRPPGTTRVPGKTELFRVATDTRDALARHARHGEDALTLLANAAFQVQSAYIGVRMAEICTAPADRLALDAISPDYAGVIHSALNLSVRSSTTVIDLCTAALGRLTLAPLRTGQHELDARRWKASYASGTPFAAIAAEYSRRIAGATYEQLETMRQQLTHRQMPARTIHGYLQGWIGKPPPPPAAKPIEPLAHRHIDIAVKNEPTALPADEVCRRFTLFADDVWRKLCLGLTGLP
jgi:hypothetical protein